MVVKMKKWSPWQHPPPTVATGPMKFRVKIERIKLEGFEHGGGGGEKVMGVELRWKGEQKHGLAKVKFHRRRPRWCKERIVRKGEVIVWEEDDDLENICWFTTAPSNANELNQINFVPWIVTFKFTYGEYNKGKMAAIGKVSLDLAELASKIDSPVIEKKIPVDLEVAGLTTQATISVLLSFVEISDSVQLGNDPTQLEEVIFSDSDNSVTFDSEGTSGSRDATPPRSMNPVQPELDKKGRFFNWKRQRLNNKPAGSDQSYKIQNLWESRDFISRDGESKLNTKSFFASFDQRSDKAAGPSACTALVTVIANWLQSNNSTAMPTVNQFENLIIDGSSEWRSLCENEVHLSNFPNKHFDLETVLRAGIRPISVLREKSFVGFFSPEKFESLTGVMSFDEIWDNEISKNPGVYIVSWNDHFFVLKGDEDGYYIIDTLGERLTEGCDQAYILRFDHGSILTGSGSNEVICGGKECCKEFIKRFLAAIPLKELEIEEQKEAVPYYSLHHRLQIEFNFCSTV